MIAISNDDNGTWKNRCRWMKPLMALLQGMQVFLTPTFPTGIVESVANGTDDWETPQPECGRAKSEFLLADKASEMMLNWFDSGFSKAVKLKTGGMYESPLGSRRWDCLAKTVDVVKGTISSQDHESSYVHSRSCTRCPKRWPPRAKKRR